MIYLVYIVVVCLLFVSILLLCFYIKTKRQLNKSTEELNSSNKKIEEQKICILELKNTFKKELCSNNGFYLEQVKFCEKQNDPNGEFYACNVFVKEIDRYTNGMSRISLVSVEVTSGFNPTMFNWAKTVIESRFSSIRNTNEITWLESEDAIKKLRREKLERIMNQ